MKDSQHFVAVEYDDFKYIKVNNERFSTTDRVGYGCM